MLIHEVSCVKNLHIKKIKDESHEVNMPYTRSKAL